MPAAVARRAPAGVLHWLTCCMEGPRVCDVDLEPEEVARRVPSEAAVVYLSEDEGPAAAVPDLPKPAARRPRLTKPADESGIPPREPNSQHAGERDEPIFLGRFQEHSGTGPAGGRGAIDLTVESDEEEPLRRARSGDSPVIPNKRQRQLSQAPSPDPPEERPPAIFLDLTNPDVQEVLEQAALAGVEVKIPGQDAPLEFECALCCDTHGIEDCFIVSMCGHKFCREGARDMVLSAIRSGDFPIPCALCKARPEPPCACCEARRSRAEAIVAARGKAGLGGTSDWCCSLDADLHLLLSVEEEEEYLARSLAAASARIKDLVACPQPDCQGLAVAGGVDMSPRLVCNVCSHEWCGKCKMAWHTGKTCDDVERERGEEVAEKGFAEFRANTRVVDCPTCGMGITKIDGCNRVTCGSCKCNICWLCGKGLSNDRGEAYKHFSDRGPCKGKTYTQLPSPPKPAKPAKKGKR